MNRFMTMVAAAASLAIGIAATSAANAGAVLDKVLKSGTLKVAAGPDWGTMSFLNNETQQLEGYDIDVAKGIADHLGVNIEFVTPSWDIITSGNWQGRWEIAMGQMTPTAVRAEKFDFPAVYFYARVVAVVHKDSKAAKPADLNGKRVGVTAGSVQEDYANHTFNPSWMNAEPIEFQFKPGEIKTYATTNVAFDDLRLGDGVRLDAVLTDGTVMDDAIRSGYPIRPLGEPLFSSPGAVPVLHGDKEFSSKIAEAIQKMKEDGTLSNLSLKWYGVDYTTEK